MYILYYCIQILTYFANSYKSDYSVWSLRKVLTAREMAENVKLVYAYVNLICTMSYTILYVVEHVS